MDLILRGGLAGLIGMAACSSVNLALYFLKLVPTTGFHYNTILFHPPGTPVNTFTLATGVIAGFVTGAFVGVIIAYLIEKTGYDYAWLKGLGVGITLWPVHVALIPSIAPRLYAVLPPIMVLSCLFFEIVFGVVAGVAIKYLAKRSQLI